MTSLAVNDTDSPHQVLTGLAFEQVNDDDDLDDTDNRDAYEELEDWYASSFPCIHSSPSFAHMGSAFVTTHNDGPQIIGQPVPLGQSQSRAQDQALGFTEWPGQHDIDEYEIDLGDSESPRIEPDITADASHAQPISKLLDIDENDPSLLEFVPKKLFSRRVQDPVADPSTRSCAHCASDVNGKLLVKCATCSFSRHLYCFSPPLKQHPALVALAAVPRHRRLPMPKLIAQWRCDTCVHRLGPLSPVQPTPASKPQHKSPSRSPTSKVLKPPQQQQWGSTGKPTHTQPFDWHTFRKAKLATIDRRDKDSDAELVLYSPSEMLLRKTATFWRHYVQRRRRLRQQHASQAAKCVVPPKRPGLHVTLTPREAAEVHAAAHKNQHKDEEKERVLFDDGLYYFFDDPRPVFQTLRRRPPRAIAATLTPEELERLVVEERAREEEETCWMDAEDEDALTPAQAARQAYRRAAMAAAEAGDPSLLGLHLAAKIIDRVAVRWLQRVRTRLGMHASNREAMERELMQQEEQRQRIKNQAQKAVGRWRFTIMFLLAIRRAMRRVQVKKELLTELQDAAEDNQAPPENRREQLAMRRIQRFFLRRVRKYIRGKKQIMVWRISRWWKRRRYAIRFRCLVIEVRVRYHETAVRSIQRCFRQYRVYKLFNSIREKYVMKMLRRVLRRWLVQRVIKKEQTRVAVYQAAVTIASVAIEPDAQLFEILRALGIVLYERSDFWHAASLLERAYRIEPNDWDPAALLACAYSHHMAWYTSYDVMNLNRADNIYCHLLDGHAADVFLLQDLVIVRLHSQDFRGGLALLAKLIELFQDDDGFPFWLLLAGVALQQVGRWEQSVEYLTYVVDLALPPPYLECDALALCAISSEHACGSNGTSREAWRAAIRLWTLEKKLASVQGHDVESYPPMAKDDSTAKLSAKRKWELLVDLAQRAYDVGHYIVVCRALLYAVERLPLGGGHSLEEQRAWWYLEEAFRHLGRVDLYMEATARSRSETTEQERKQLEKDANDQASSFSQELKIVGVREVVERIRVQYASATDNVQSEWKVEDVENE